MSSPSSPATHNPALVAQAAVVRLPRWALPLLCLAYILAGFVGREPWKSADITAFGFMRALALGDTSWMAPQIMGYRPEHDGVLSYWLGAASIGVFGPWLHGAMASRIPFMLMLALAFYATWYAIYHLARQPAAQPLSFAFGGEAQPKDYARAMADAGVLGLIACLGLPLLSHETTPAVVQLGLASLMLYAVAAMPYKTVGPVVALLVSAEGLTLSGAPVLAVCWCLGGAVLHGLCGGDRGRRWAVILLTVAACSAFVAWTWGLWRLRIEPLSGLSGIKDSLKLVFWFGWPVWPLAAWGLWRWRRQWLVRQPSLHLAWPAFFAICALVSFFCVQSLQRSLLLSLPALAALAAFALPTFKRSVSALIDWFTLLFFSGCALVVWVVWLSLQTGFPAKPAKNVARLAPGYEHEFSLLLFALAVAATLAWIALVVWRIGRNRAAIWKSMVLPAGGACLGWVLAMTLWLPMLDHARSYTSMVQRIRAEVPRTDCLLVYGLSPARSTALQYHGGYRLYPFDSAAPCREVIVDGDARVAFEALNLLGHWKLSKTINRLTEKTDSVLIYRTTRP